MIKAIIFDLDDTLYPERAYVLSGFRAVAKYLEQKHRIPAQKSFSMLEEAFDRGLRKKNFNDLLQHLNLNEPVENLIKIYRTHTPTLKLYPDAEKILHALKGKMPLGIITDGIPETQNNKIRSLGIENSFTKIIINDIGSGTTKTQGTSFATMLEGFNIPTKEAAYVGDNPEKDITTPHNLGMTTILIRRKNGEYAHVAITKRPDHIITTLEEIMPLLRS
jgi:putative hydrolase of the HAD superfamily